MSPAAPQSRGRSLGRLLHRFQRRNQRMNADSSAKFQPTQPCKKRPAPFDGTSDFSKAGSLALLHLHHNSEVDNLTIPCRTEYPIFINHDPMLQEAAMVRTPILGAIHDDQAAPVGVAQVQAITTDNEALNRSLPQASGGLQGSSPLLPPSNSFAAKAANEDQVPLAAGWPAQQLALPPPPVLSPPGDEDVLQDFLMEMTRHAPTPILKTPAKKSCASAAQWKTCSQGPSQGTRARRHLGCNVGRATSSKQHEHGWPAKPLLWRSGLCFHPSGGNKGSRR
jgi:hypothetical protein